MLLRALNRFRRLASRSAPKTETETSSIPSPKRNRVSSGLLCWAVLLLLSVTILPVVLAADHYPAPAGTGDFVGDWQVRSNNVGGGFGDIAFDPDGNMYLQAIKAGFALVKLSPGGDVLWYRGAPGSGPGQFQTTDYGTGISTYTPSGGPTSIYVLDAGNCRVQIYDQDGNQYSSFPIYQDCGPTGCCDTNWWIRGNFGGLEVSPLTGDVYLVEAGREGAQPRILQFDKFGNFLRAWNTPFRILFSVTVDAGTGDVWATTYFGAVSHFTPDGTFIETLFKDGSSCPDPAAWNRGGGERQDLAVRSGTIYIVSLSRVEKYDPTGSCVLDWGDAHGTPPVFGEAVISSSSCCVPLIGITFDSSGHVWLANDARIIEWTDTGVHVRTITKPDCPICSSSGNPANMAVDAARDTIFTTQHFEIMRYDLSGHHKGYWTWEGHNSADRCALFSQITVHPTTGDLYAPCTVGLVRQYSPSGVVIREYGTRCGPCTGALGEIYYPLGIAVDPSGNVYVSSQHPLGNRVTEFFPDGMMRCWGLSTGCSGPAVQFNFATGTGEMEIGPDGNVYVMDSIDSSGQPKRVRVFDPTPSSSLPPNLVRTWGPLFNPDSPSEQIAISSLAFQDPAAGPVALLSAPWSPDGVRFGFRIYKVGFDGTMLGVALSNLDGFGGAYSQDIQIGSDGDLYSVEAAYLGNRLSRWSPRFDFAVSTSSVSATVLEGGSAAYDLSVSLTAGSNQPVTLSIVSGLPTGASTFFTHNPVNTGEASTLQVVTSVSGPLGDFTLLLRAVGGGKSHDTTVNLHIYDFSVSIVPSSRTVLRGGTVSYAVNITPAPGSSTTGLPSISLSSSLPLGVTGMFNPNAGSPAGFTSTLTLSVGPSTSLGDLTITAEGLDSRALEGGSRSSSANLHVFDLVVPNDITVEATSPAGAMVTYSASATGNEVPVACNPASGSTFPLGTTTVVCTATDEVGNTGSASFRVTVQDTTPPVLSLPADIVLEATGPSGAVATFAATAFDAVDGVLTPTCSSASGSTFPLGTTTVTCTATDANGNTGSASFHVTVVDTTPPVVNVPPDILLEATGPAGAVASFTATATDLVDGPLPVNCSANSGSTFALGSTLVTCTATDAHGNTGSASFTVTVQDTTPPALTVPADMVLEATGPSGAATTFSASATDSVDGSIVPICTPASGSTFPLGEATVNCTATDSHANSSTGSFQVTVQDTTPPSLSLPSSILATASDPAGGAVSFSANAVDIVDGPVPVSCSPPSGSSFPLGTTTVNCSASDAHGNISTGSFTVTVYLIQRSLLDSDFNPIDTAVDTVFTPMCKTCTSLTLVATNPGTYQYDLAIKNTGSDTATFTVTITIPAGKLADGSPIDPAFYLKGTNPIFVYADTARTVDITGQVSISTTLLGSNVKTISITISGVPQGAVREITIHFDYRLKGTNNWDGNSRTTFHQSYVFPATVQIGSTPSGTINNISVLTPFVGQKVTGIGGYILDTNGNPKVGLVVRLYDNNGVQLTCGTCSDSSASDGFYYLQTPGNAAGKYVVRVYDSMGALKTSSTIQTLALYQFNLVNFQLNPSDPTIYGWIRDQFGNGIQGATVKLYDVSGRLVAQTTTSRGGFYAFSFSAPGQYTVKVVYPGGNSSSVTLLLVQFERRRLDF